MAKLSVGVITFNEEDKMECCLRSVQWADEIVVVDSFSTDRTLSICRNFTDKVYQRKFDNFSAQKNFLLDKTTHDWTLMIDADEVVEDSLKQDILVKLNGKEALAGYRVKRRNFFMGKELLHGAQSEDWPLRLFRKTQARFNNVVHEEVILKARVGKLEGSLLHYSTAKLEEYLYKLNQYTSLEARLLKDKSYKVNIFDLYFKPIIRFFYYYFLKLGFLDGYPGFLFHLLASFYVVIKYAKLKELRGA